MDEHRVVGRCWAARSDVDNVDVMSQSLRLQHRTLANDDANAARDATILPDARASRSWLRREPEAVATSLLCQESEEIDVFHTDARVERRGLLARSLLPRFDRALPPSFALCLQRFDLRKSKTN